MERMQASKMEYHFRISSLGTNGAPTAMFTQTTHFNHFLNHHNLEDSVPADMGDEIELVCFNSGVMAVFQRPQKRDVLHHIIADEEELFASTKPVFLNHVYIFKYVYPNKLSGEEVPQISVGQIINMYEDDPASPSQTFDIRFFPP